MKTFEFSSEGLEQSEKYKDYIGVIKERLNNPQLFPLVMGIVVLGITALTGPMASSAAYKAIVAEQVAFKLIKINL